MEIAGTVGTAGHVPPPGVRKPPPAIPDAPAAGLKRAHFKGSRLPVLLLFPQLAILLFFFFIPAIRALTQSLTLADPFGNAVHFVGLDNFIALLKSPNYHESLKVTVVFTIAQNVVTIVVALVLAFATDRVIGARGIY